LTYPNLLATVRRTPLVELERTQLKKRLLVVECFARYRAAFVYLTPGPDGVF